MNRYQLATLGLFFSLLGGCTSEAEAPDETPPDGGWLSGRSGSSAGRSGAAGLAGTNTSGTAGYDAGWSGFAGSTGKVGKSGWTGSSGKVASSGTMGKSGFSSGTMGKSGFSSGCPLSVPAERDWCRSENQVCSYGTWCGADQVAVCVGQEWRVTASPCDGGCPPYEPVRGTSCAPGQGTCSYPGPCGGLVQAECLPASGLYGTYWQVSSDPACSACPPFPPPEGSYCDSPRGCSYPNSCGGTDNFYCESDRWRLPSSSCAPSCPVGQPREGDPCFQEGSECQWTNYCGLDVYGYCMAGGWRLKDPGCASCPWSMPPAGTYCGGMTGICNYYAYGINFGCYCDGGLAWTCTPVRGYPEAGVDVGPWQPSDAGIIIVDPGWYLDAGVDSSAR